MEESEGGKRRHDLTVSEEVFLDIFRNEEGQHREELVAMSLKAAKRRYEEIVSKISAIRFYSKY